MRKNTGYQKNEPWNMPHDQIVGIIRECSKFKGKLAILKVAKYSKTNDDPPTFSRGENQIVLPKPTNGDVRALKRYSLRPADQRQSSEQVGA